MKLQIIAKEESGTMNQNESGEICDENGYSFDEWEKIADQYESYIFNFIYYLCQDYNETEDLTQETFIKVFENLGQFRHESSIKTWLTRIAINVYKEHRRKKRSHQSISLEVMTVGEICRFNCSDPERIVIRKDLQWCVHHVLQHHVNDKYREILVLRYMNDLSYTEIADVLQISESAVKSRLSRARMAFKEHLEKTGCAKLMSNFICYCEGVYEA